MIKVLNVVLSLCAVAYMLVRFKQGAGVLEIDIPCEYFRNRMCGFYSAMLESYRLAKYLLAFECMALVLPKIYDCCLRRHFSFVKPICALLPCLRFVADICCILGAIVLMAFVCLISHERKSFEFVDASGNSTMLVRDINSEQE